MPGAYEFQLSKSSLSCSLLPFELTEDSSKMAEGLNSAFFVGTEVEEFDFFYRLSDSAENLVIVSQMHLRCLLVALLELFKSFKHEEKFNLGSFLASF